MSSSTNKQVTTVAVVIRGSHERTEDLCLHLAQQQVPEAYISVIHERPFSQALRRSFEIGLEFGLDWTLCLDADILLQANSLCSLVKLVENHPDTILGGHGRVYDKFFGKRRYAGLHLYRTSLLTQAIKLIPEANISLRPETFMKDAMVAKGHAWIQFKEVIAIHDFEQYYRDIYRKMIVRANKAPEQIDHLMGRALVNSPADPDFLVCLWGLRIGLGLAEPILLDAKQWDADFDTLLCAHGIEEKQPLSQENLQVLSRKLLSGQIRKGSGHNRYSNLVDIPNKMLYRIGMLLEAAGFHFKSWSSQ